MEKRHREIELHVTKMNSLTGTEEETREAKEVGYVCLE
jgi:hypothetical protein